MILNLIPVRVSPKEHRHAPERWSGDDYVCTIRPKNGFPDFIVHLNGTYSCGLRRAVISSISKYARCSDEHVCLLKGATFDNKEYVIPYTKLGQREFFLTENTNELADWLSPAGFERGSISIGDANPDFVYTKITPAIEQELIRQHTPMVPDNRGQMLWRVIPFHSFQEIPEPYQLLGVYPAWRCPMNMYEILCKGLTTGYMYLTICPKNGSATDTRPRAGTLEAFAAPDILLSGTLDTADYSLSAFAGVAVVRQDAGRVMYDPEYIMSDSMRDDFVHNESAFRSRYRLPCDLRHKEIEPYAPGAGFTAFRVRDLKSDSSVSNGRWMLDRAQTLNGTVYDENYDVEVNHTYYPRYWNSLIAPDTDTVLLKPGRARYIWKHWSRACPEGQSVTAESSTYASKLPQVLPPGGERIADPQCPDKTLKPIPLLLKKLGVKHVLYMDDSVPDFFAECLQKEGLQLWQIPFRDTVPLFFRVEFTGAPSFWSVSDDEFMEAVESDPKYRSALRLDKLWLATLAIGRRYDLEIVPY